MWAVYRDPRDYPKKYVTRRWSLSARGLIPDRDPLAVVESLESARAVVPGGATRVVRQVPDDSAIVETWLGSWEGAENA